MGQEEMNADERHQELLEQHRRHWRGMVYLRKVTLDLITWSRKTHYEKRLAKAMKQERSPW